jgi:hypothetical protein
MRLSVSLALAGSVGSAGISGADELQGHTLNEWVKPKNLKDPVLHGRR